MDNRDINVVTELTFLADNSLHSHDRDIAKALLRDEPVKLGEELVYLHELKIAGVSWLYIYRGCEVDVVWLSVLSPLELLALQVLD